MPPAYTAGKIEPPREFFVPNGKYKIKVVEAKDDTDEKARDILDIVFRVILTDGSDGPKFNQRFWFTEKARFRYDQFLTACNQHPGEGSVVEYSANDLIGFECEAMLKTRKYKNGAGEERTTNEVANYIFNEFA